MHIRHSKTVGVRTIMLKHPIKQKKNTHKNQYTASPYTKITHSWHHDLEAEAKRMGYTWGRLERLAQDRDAWGALVGAKGDDDDDDDNDDDGDNGDNTRDWPRIGMPGEL